MKKISSNTRLYVNINLRQEICFPEDNKKGSMEVNRIKFAL